MSERKRVRERETVGEIGCLVSRTGVVAFVLEQVLQLQKENYCVILFLIILFPNCCHRVLWRR